MATKPIRIRQPVEVVAGERALDRCVRHCPSERVGIRSVLVEGTSAGQVPMTAEATVVADRVIRVSRRTPAAAVDVFRQRNRITKRHCD